MNSPPPTPTPTIILTPRPLARGGGRLTLIPLITPQVESDISRLPAEIWLHIFELAFSQSHPSSREAVWRKNLLIVCKPFKRLVEPLFYAYPPLHNIDNFIRLVELLNQRDAQPTALARIPYAAPGRWIQVLDLLHIAVTRPSDKIAIDRALGMAFNYTPLLSTFMLHPSCRLSKITIETLANAECTQSLTTITGLSPPLAYVTCRDASQLFEDPIVKVLSRSPNLERLGLCYINDSGDGEKYIFRSSIPPDVFALAPSLKLPKLTHLSIKGLFSTASILSLANSSLPSLRSLTITSHDHLSPESIFLPILMKSHCASINSLRFITPPSYMRQPQPSQPDSTLLQFPNLSFLSLSSLRPLTPPPAPSLHPLHCLVIPKPVSWLVPEIEKLLRVLPGLKVIMFHQENWLPKSVGARARESGTQGEMLSWKRRFGARGVAILDASGRSSAP